MKEGNNRAWRGRLREENEEGWNRGSLKKRKLLKGRQNKGLKNKFSKSKQNKKKRKKQWKKYTKRIKLKTKIKGN